MPTKIFGFKPHPQFVKKKRHWYLSKCSRTGGIYVMSSAEVQIVSVKNAPRKANSFTHNIVLFQPEEN